MIYTEGKGGRKGEEHQCVVASHVPPTGDLAHNPVRCPDWESNQALNPLSHTSQGMFLHVLKGHFHNVQSS